MRIYALVPGGRAGDPTPGPCSRRYHPNIISHSPSRPIIGPHSHANGATHAGSMAEAVTTRGGAEGRVTVQGPGRKPMEWRTTPAAPATAPENRTVGPKHTQTKQRALAHGRASNDNPTHFAKGRKRDCPGPREETNEGRMPHTGGTHRSQHGLISSIRSKEDRI